MSRRTAPAVVLALRLQAALWDALRHRLIDVGARTAGEIVREALAAELQREPRTEPATAADGPIAGQRSVKIHAALLEAVRERAKAEGREAIAVVRDALAAHLAV